MKYRGYWRKNKLADFGQVFSANGNLLHVDEDMYSFGIEEIFSRSTSAIDIFEKNGQNFGNNGKGDDKGFRLTFFMNKDYY